MKKIILLLLIPFFLSAADMQYELKIYATLLHNLFPKKQSIKVWSDDEQKEEMLSKLSNIQIVKKIKNADILIVEKNKKLPKRKLIFTINYLIFKYYEKSAIGGFYWKAGRPNILFLRQNLAKHHIKLPAEFNEFMEDRL